MARRRKSNWIQPTRRAFDKMQTEIIGSCNGSNSSDSKNNRTICATAGASAAAAAAANSSRCGVADAGNNNNHHHKNNHKNSYSGCSSNTNGGAGNNCDFFNFATILFAMFMIVNVQLSSGLIELQTEKEKHGKSRATIYKYSNNMRYLAIFRRCRNARCVSHWFCAIFIFRPTRIYIRKMCNCEWAGRSSNRKKHFASKNFSLIKIAFWK